MELHNESLTANNGSEKDEEVTLNAQLYNYQHSNWLLAMDDG